MTHCDQHWHANDNCFSCSGCNVGLIGKPFLPRDGAIFCSTTCLHQASAVDNDRQSADDASLDDDDDFKTLSASDNNGGSFFRSATTTLASTSLSTTMSSKFSFARGLKFEPFSANPREPSPTPSDIMLRENLRNPAPPKSPPEVKKVLKKSQKNYSKQKEEAILPDFDHLQRQHQHQHLQRHQGHHHQHRRKEDLRDDVRDSGFLSNQDLDLDRHRHHKNYWKRKESTDIPSLELALPSYLQQQQQQQQQRQPEQHQQRFEPLRRQEQQHQHQQPELQRLVDDQSLSPISLRSQSFSSSSKVPAADAIPGTPKHRNESAADRKPSWTSGSESTAEDFSPFKPVTSVQQLLSLYSQHQVKVQSDTRKLPDDMIKPEVETSTPINEIPTLDSRVEASRQMLERNLERLIVQQGLDAISQLTYAMTPEQIEKLIIRTEQVIRFANHPRGLDRPTVFNCPLGSQRHCTTVRPMLYVQYEIPIVRTYILPVHSKSHVVKSVQLYGA